MVLWVIGTISYQSYREYQRSYVRAQAEATRLAAIATDQIEQGVQTVDLTLQHAVERQHLNQLFGGTLPEDLINNFKLWVDNIPQIVSMVMINQEGVAEIAVNKKEYANWINYKSSFSQFLPFLLLKADESTTNIVMPYQSQTNTSQHLALVARRLSKLDGSFGGIVVAAIRLEFFLEFFNSIDTGKNRFIDVITDSGKSLFEGVAHPRLWQSNPLLWQEITALGASYSNNVFLHHEDGKKVVVAYRKLDHLPLTVVVAIDEADFLSDFWRDRFKDISFLLSFYRVRFGRIRILSLPWPSRLSGWKNQKLPLFWLRRPSLSSSPI